MRNLYILLTRLMLVVLFVLLVQLSGWAQALSYPSDDGPGNPYTLNGITGVQGTAIVGLKSAAAPVCSSFVTGDNENNSLTGTPDNDMDIYLSRTDSRQPIEFNIFVTDATVTSAQLSLLVWDIDYASGERDEVSFNGHVLGYLSGTNNSWSTNSFTIDPAWVNHGVGDAGKNLVRVRIDVGNGGWMTTVDWGQLNINGGCSDVAVTSAILNKTCFTPCENVAVTIEVDANPAASVIVETLLIDNGGITVDQHDDSFNATTATETYTVTLEEIACTTLPGQDYLVKIFVYANDNGSKGVQLAYKEVAVPVCGCGKVDAGPDVMICKGDKTQLNASGALTYSWSPSTGLSATDIANPVASPTVTTTYTVTGTFPAVELLGNPGFESGNVGFTSAYTYVPDGAGNEELMDEGTYGVGGNAANYHPDFVATPHSGTSMMMIVNGSEVPNRTVWEQTISVAPNSDFNFSVWCYRLASTTSNPTLQLIINGVNVGSAFTVSNAAWTEMARTWNSGSATSAIVRIVDTNTAAGDNDFALDDLSFKYNCVGGSVDQVTVTVDNVPPVANCKNITVDLDINGNATITAADVDNGSTDNCKIESLAISKNTFNCGNLGANTVILTVTDSNGNIATCTSTVTVQDKIAPTIAKCAVTRNIEGCSTADIKGPDFSTVSAASSEEVFELAYNGGSASDACGITSVTYVDVAVGSCPIVVTRTWTLKDGSGNTSTCTQTIKVDDTTLPVMVIHDICVYLTNDGKWTLNNLDKLAISKDITDNCTAFKDLIISFSPVTFDCNDATKKVPVTVKATDKCDNTATAIAYVLVADTIKPVAKCQDVTTTLDEFGQAYIFQAQVNASKATGAPAWAKFFANETGGSYDNCGVDSLFLSRQLFTCADVAAPVEVTLSAVDISGNVGTCKAKVTVKDATVPVMPQVANVTKSVAPGVCTTKVTYPEIKATDNCPLTIAKIAGLGANGDFPVGTTTETWQATDGGGNFVNMSFTVTITTYNAAPAIATVADITKDEDAPAFDVALTGIGYGVDCIPQQITSLDVVNSNTALLTVTKNYTLGAATGSLTVTPLANKYGEATITLTLKDNGGTANGGVDTTVKTFKIKINPVNDVPTVTPIADQVVIIPNSLSVNVVTPFKDVDDGDVLTFAVTKADGTALPAWMAFNATTGLLTGTPTLANYGAVDIKVVATDKAGATVQDIFNVLVKGEFQIKGKVVRKTGTPVLITQGLDPVATPAAGVQVVLKQGGVVVVSTTTAADGTYSFAVPGGDYGVFVIVPDYTQEVSQNVTVNAANPIKDKVDFTLWSGNKVITNVRDLAGDFGIKLYPNPTSGKVNIDLTWNESKKVDVMVYNILGVQVFRNNYFTGERITIDLSDQVTGIYLLKLNVDGQSFVRKLTLDKR